LTLSFIVLSTSSDAISFIQPPIQALHSLA